MAAMTHIPGLSQPSDDAILRRYLTEDKFKWLIRDRAIYLRQLAKLNDPFEGATPPKTQARIEQYIRESNVDRESVNPTTYPSYHARERHYVSCWFESSTESDAMWKLYANHKSSSVIETTYAQLAAAFDKNDWAGRVLYVNFDDVEDSILNDFNRVFLKRAEFAHEKEVRIARRLFRFHKNAEENIVSKIHQFRSKQWLDSLYDQPAGVSHPVELKSLLNRIVVHPQADECRLDQLREQLAEAGIHCPVAKSTLSDRPFLGY